MLVHVQISDPWDWVAPTRRGASVRVEIADDDLRSGDAVAGPVIESEGMPFEVTVVHISSRLVGHPLTDVLDGGSPSINGRFERPDGSVAAFIGSLHDAATAVGPWPFDER
jgi:hypothetical protein